MKSIVIKILSICIILSGSQSFAETNLELPVDIEKQKIGYNLYPVVQCPRPKKKYDDLLSKLGSIKAQIKKEACKQEELDKIKEVDSLETLVTSGRIEFIDLLKKGTSADGELSQAEVDKLRSYVDSVVKKAAVITGLANNPACFDEESKVSTLSLLSSIVGEVAGALGAIPGPLGAKIGLGGKLAAGLLSSIDMIVQARKTYDYDKYEDQKNYLNNLCAYYEFKADLDKETDTVTVVSDLDELIYNAENLLGRLSSDCEECRTIIDDFENKVETDEPYRLLEEVSAPERREVVKSFRDASWQEMKEYYMTSVLEADSQMVASEGVKSDRGAGPGTYTIRTLRSKIWAEDEIKALEELDESGLPEGGRREVMKVQDQIESFLVDHEGPRYVQHLVRVMSRDFSKLHQDARTALYDLSQIRLNPDPNYEYSWRNDAIDNIHDLFRNDLDFANIITQNQNPEIVKSLVESSKRLIKRDINLMRSNYSVLTYQCQFYQYSSLRFTGPVGRACSGATYRLEVLKEFFAKVQDTSYGARNARSLKVFFEKPKQYTRNWVESTSRVLQYMSEKDNL